jgi:hypothetical protein
MNCTESELDQEPDRINLKKKTDPDSGGQLITGLSDPDTYRYPQNC